MTIRAQRVFFWCITVALTAAGVGAAVFAAVMPLSAHPFLGGSIKSPRAMTDRSRYTPLSFQNVAALNLRRPLDNPPILPSISSKATPLASAPAAPAPCKLVGTIDEPGRSLALFEDAAGHRLLKSVGQNVDGAVVLTVAAGQATIVWQGASVVLSLPRDGATAPAVRNEGRNGREQPTPTAAMAGTRPDPVSQSSGAQPNAEGGVSTDEREMRAFLDRKLMPEGN
jgi:hypothetical protein